MLSRRKKEIGRRRMLKKRRLRNREIERPQMLLGKKLWSRRSQRGLVDVCLSSYRKLRWMIHLTATPCQGSSWAPLEHRFLLKSSHTTLQSKLCTSAERASRIKRAKIWEKCY